MYSAPDYCFKAPDRSIDEPTVYDSSDCRITLRRRGADRYNKISFPLHIGVYSEIETKDYLFHFNLNAEIIRAKGKGEGWRHPHEWLKRTMGNDWVYYSTGGYTGVFEATGEYYLPNLPYPSNRVIGGKPFEDDSIARFVRSWHSMIEDLSVQLRHAPQPVVSFLEQVQKNNPDQLGGKAEELFASCGGRVTVLPPDARHVDYNVIPLTVASGCLYKCRFCKVKNKNPYKKMTKGEIDTQIGRLQAIYAEDLPNYNSLFLGEHDALQAGQELLAYAIEKSSEAFGFHQSFVKGSNVFLFGSVDSLLEAEPSLFYTLNKMEPSVYINIGLESADPATLKLLGKPLEAGKVEAAFFRMQEINETYPSVEVTANFVMDGALPESHYPAFLSLVREGVDRVRSKGCVYLSPLQFDKPSRSHLFTFNRFKVLSRLPTFLYIIQRL